MVWFVQASFPACPLDCPVRVLRAGSRREHGETPHAWHRPQGTTHSTDTGEHTHHCIATVYVVCISSGGIWLHDLLHIKKRKIYFQ